MKEENKQSYTDTGDAIVRDKPGTEKKIEIVLWRHETPLLKTRREMTDFLTFHGR